MQFKLNKMKKLLILAVISTMAFTSCSCEPVPNEKLQLDVGESVELTGTLSDQPWQHMIDMRPEYPYISYVDFEDGDQLVVYTKQLAVCNGEFGFKGKVIEIQGESKNPNSDEKYTEIQVLADEITCDGGPVINPIEEKNQENMLLEELEDAPVE